MVGDETQNRYCIMCFLALTVPDKILNDLGQWYCYEFIVHNNKVLLFL